MLIGASIPVTRQPNHGLRTPPDTPLQPERKPFLPCVGEASQRRGKRANMAQSRRGWRLSSAWCSLFGFLASFFLRLVRDYGVDAAIRPRGHMSVVPGNDAPRGRYGCGLPGSSKRERTCSTCRLLTWPAGMGAARTWTHARGLQDQNATARFPTLATAERVPRAAAAARCKRWRPGRRPLER